MHFNDYVPPVPAFASLFSFLLPGSICIAYPGSRVDLPLLANSSFVHFCHSKPICQSANLPLTLSPILPHTLSLSLSPFTPRKRDVRMPIPPTLSALLSTLPPPLFLDTSTSPSFNPDGISTCPTSNNDFSLFSSVFTFSTHSIHSHHHHHYHHHTHYHHQHYNTTALPSSYSS